jgi:hypothetical protein
MLALHLISQHERGNTNDLDTIIFVLDAFADVDLQATCQTL